MMKDVRKALGTFWRLQFLQGVIFEDFHHKHGFLDPLETISRQFTAQLRKSKVSMYYGAKDSPSFSLLGASKGNASFQHSI